MNAIGKGYKDNSRVPVDFEFTLCLTYTDCKAYFLTCLIGLQDHVTFNVAGPILPSLTTLDRRGENTFGRDRDQTQLLLPSCTASDHFKHFTIRGHLSTLAYFLLDPTAPGSIPRVPEIF